MCFYNSMSKKAKELAARYGRNLSVVEIAEKFWRNKSNTGLTHSLFQTIRL